MSAGILFGACDIFFLSDGSEHLRMHGYIIHFKMLFSLDLLLSEKWSWFPTSSQALHLLLKPGDCSVLVIWSSKTQSMNNYLFLFFCGSIARDNSSRDFHPLRHSFADVVQADDDVGLCQYFYVEFLCCLKAPDIEVVFNRRILLFLTRLWPNIEWLWPKAVFLQLRLIYTYQRCRPTCKEFSHWTHCYWGWHQGCDWTRTWKSRLRSHIYLINPDST